MNKLKSVTDQLTTVTNQLTSVTDQLTTVTNKLTTTTDQLKSVMEKLKTVINQSKTVMEKLTSVTDKLKSLYKKRQLVAFLKALVLISNNLRYFGVFPAFLGRGLRGGIEFAPANQKFVDDYNNARRIVDAAASHASPVKPQPAP